MFKQQFLTENSLELRLQTEQNCQPQNVAVNQQLLPVVSFVFFDYYLFEQTTTKTSWQTNACQASEEEKNPNSTHQQTA